MLGPRQFQISRLRVLRKQRGQGSDPKTHAGGFEKLSSSLPAVVLFGDCLLIIERRVHGYVLRVAGFDEWPGFRSKQSVSSLGPVEIVEGAHQKRPCGDVGGLNSIS